MAFLLFYPRCRSLLHVTSILASLAPSLSIDYAVFPFTAHNAWFQCLALVTQTTTFNLVWRNLVSSTGEINKPSAPPHVMLSVGMTKLLVGGQPPGSSDALCLYQVYLVIHD